MIKLRIFVSSVQKELDEERRAVKTLVTSDPFLDEHCVPILYEDEPSMLKPASQGYLNDLAKCQFYLLIIGSIYGKRFKGLSPIHHEYHFARRKDLPILVCVRGDNKIERDPAIQDLIEEIKSDGHKYHRFSDLRQLQRIVLDRLHKNQLPRGPFSQRGHDIETHLGKRIEVRSGTSCHAARHEYACSNRVE